MVGMMVAQEDVGDRLRRHAERRERIEDQRAPGDHPWVDDDGRISIAHQDDGAGGVLAGVAGVEQVDAGHERIVGHGRRAVLHVASAGIDTHQAGFRVPSSGPT